MSVARQVANGLLAALLSPACAVCARVLDAPSGGPVCESCWRAVSFLTPPLCDRCGYPLPAASSRSTLPRRDRCRACSLFVHVDRARALGAYDGALRDMLHVLKYDDRRSLAPRLGALVRSRCGAVCEDTDAVVPVPLHLVRRYTRGFNQADLLARAIGPPVWRALRRTRPTPRQASLSAAARTRNVAGAFGASWWAVRNRARLRGARLVLVDDVSTTGATLEACAVVLKELGVARVHALVIARTLRRDETSPRIDD
jgi:ComF family protein